MRCRREETFGAEAIDSIGLEVTESGGYQPWRGIVTYVGESRDIEDLSAARDE